MTQDEVRGTARTFRPSVSVLALGVAAMVFILATFTTMAVDRHRGLLGDAHLQNERLADSLEEHTKGTLRLAALTLVATAERLGREGADLAPFDPGFDSFLAALAARAPALAGIRVLDREGRYLHSHPGRPKAAIEVGDSDYFQAARTGRKGVFVGAPTVSRVNGEWVLPLSLRREGPDGGFAGVVVVVVRLAEFTGLFEAVRSRPNGSVGLFRRDDGMLLARVPVDAAMLGRLYADGPLFREHLPKAPRGSYLQVVATDQTLRQASYRAATEQGVVIGVSTAYDDVMAEWWNHLLVLVLVGGPLLLATAWATWRLYRELQHRERVERLLAYRSADLELANEELRQVARMSAHHLQEPLRTILSYSQLLVRRLGADGESGEGAEYVTFIGNGVTRMKGLLSALQRYLSLEREGGTSERVALGEVLDEVTDRMGPVLAAAAIAVEHGDLPLVIGSRDQFATLFTNLIESASAHHARSKPLSISVAAARRNDQWELTVTDSGSDQWAGRRAFDLIAPGGWGSQEPSLGLALCRKIVHLHGGRMRMEPGTETGARVVISLPMTEGRRAIE